MTDAEIILAETTFVHNDFRAQVSEELQVTNAPDSSSGKTLVVSLNNLSSSSGSFESRVTINFSNEFNNYVEVPTESGRLRLHLNRDGTLRLDPDSGGFT